MDLLGLETNQSDRLNHVTAAAGQYLSRNHMADWGKTCLQISDRDKP